MTAQGPRAGAGPSPGTGRGQSLAPDPALRRTRRKTVTPTGQHRDQNRGRDQGLEVPVETKINILIHQNHNSPILQHYISEWLLFTKAQNMPANTFTITSLCFCISVVSFKKNRTLLPKKTRFDRPCFKTRFAIFFCNKKNSEIQFCAYKLCIPNS